MRFLRQVIRFIERLFRAFVYAIIGPPVRVTPLGPKISVVSPFGGWPGSFLTIDGLGFSPKLDDNAVEIGGAPALIVRAAPNQLHVIVNEAAVSGPVRVTVNGITTTAVALFERLPWPEVIEGRDGPPKFFHGPQHGTPALGAQNQKVLVILSAATDDLPTLPNQERATEEASFAQADRFWREASYQRTSFKFEFTPWLNLPQNRSYYIWSQSDVDWARHQMLRWTKRHCAVTGNRLLATNLLGVFSVVDISNPAAPFEITNIPTLDKPMHVVVFRGSIAYVASGDGGLFVLDLTPRIPTVINHIGGGVWLHSLDLAGHTLVAAALGAGLQVYDLSAPYLPQLRATLPFGGHWATCVRLVGNRAYVGVNSNTHHSYGATVRVVDVSNRSAPVELGAANIGNNRAWVLGLDVAGNTCAVATDGEGLQIFDVSGGMPVLRGVEKSILRLHGVALNGTAAYGAGADAGFIAWDISDSGNPRKTGGFTTSDCCGVTVSGSKAYLSLAPAGLQVADLGNVHQPAPGAGIPLADGNWMPSFGVDAAHLRPLLRNAIQYQNLIKHDALYVHAIQKAKTNLGLNIDDFEGIIVVIHGKNGRAQSGPQNEVWFEGTTIRFNNLKGVIWLPSDSSWGRKAHEIGHWFKMQDIYEEVQSDGTIFKGTAQLWDMAGEHDTGPLFCGRQADQMKLFDPANIERREWEPGTGPKHEPFEIVAHDVNEDSGGRIHLLELVVADGLSYFIEVRQKPGVVSFDQSIPIAPGAPHDGAVLVTRSVTSETFFNNTFERSTMLVGVLTPGQSVSDPPRLLRIEAEAILNARPLIYRVIVHWNEVPPDAGPDGPIDLTITPWNTETWETPDIWINSELNDVDKTPAGRRYQFCEPGKPEVPVLNGDPPWIKRPNSVFARIRNSGPEQAKNVLVSFATTSPPGIGDNGRTPDGKLIAWVTHEVKTIPAIAANTAEVVEFTWTPNEDKHTCILITISPQQGEKETQDNNSARENVAAFDSRGSSSHEPIILDAEVRSPFTVVRNVNLLVRGLPDGWHAVVDHAWTWVDPQGTKPVRVVAWTDLHSPRDSGHTRIPAFATPRIEGWTDLDHLLVPIGGILMPIRANAHAELQMEVRLKERGLVVEVLVSPAVGGVAIAAEVTDRFAAKTLLHGTTDADGRALMSGWFQPGTYLVQAFSASTVEVGAAETRSVTFVVP